jgi:hypothetical protein
MYYDGVGHVTLMLSLSTTLHRLAPTLDAVDGFVREVEAKAVAAP